jgi:tRNA threonylcarbamoyladenosine biosynthesis protein TsaE
MNTPHLIHTETDMEQFGGHLALSCAPQSVIYLSGDLGAGKTTLARGFLRALGYCGAVKSPTYTLLEPYYLPHHTVYHLDLYRLSAAEELEYLGLRDLLTQAALWLIEWPQRGDDFLPPATINIHIAHHGSSRILSLNSTNPINQENSTSLKL